MKKTILYFSIIVAGVLWGASCSLNETPVFDDSEAFAAFEKATLSVNENAGTLRVPVRLTSLSGKTSTVTYQIIDSTAQEGRDFEVVGGSSVLTFSAEDPVQYIVFNILEHAGVFTGDRSFGIKLTGGGSVNLGAVDAATITIADLDHPLSFMFGNYKGTGVDAWDFTSYTWLGVVFEKDAEDVTKVWIRNIFEAAAAATAATKQSVYGIVNEDKTLLTIPVHQAVGTVSGYNAFFEGATIPFSMMATGEQLVFDINANGTVSLRGAYEAGVGAYNPSSGAFAGWFERVSELVFTKQ
jgi:hypothetical protein